VKAEAKRAEGKSESPEPKSKRKARMGRARAWNRRANEKLGREERELGTEDLNGGPFKKQTIN